MNRLLCLGFLAALVISLPAARLVADEKKDPSRDDKAQAAKGDQEFVHEAATGGMLEVKLGQLAAENASDASVKKFGERMVADHSKACKELKELVEKKGMNCPMELDPKQQKEYDRMASLKGAEFDREYVQMMVQDHKEDIAAFEAQAKNGQDAALREFATKALPTLREHANMIQLIASKTK